LLEEKTMRRSLVVGACVLGLAALTFAGTAAIRASSQERSATGNPAPAAEPSSAPTDAPAGDPAVSPEKARPGQPVEVDMRNVDLRLTGGMVVHVYALRGRFRPTRSSAAPFLDDNDS